MNKREFDLILWGATGFTGQLVVQYLVATYGVGKDLHWAIAGRNADKLQQVRDECVPAKLRSQLEMIIADSEDPVSLAAMTSRTRVICSTVGPYAKYGTPLVAACVTAGTHYCDLTGEVPWMADVIHRFQSAAQSSGARIVHTCGFDSIPSDMGTWFLQQSMLERHGVPAVSVKARVGRNKGTASGGTVASMLLMMEQATKDKHMRKLLADPYALYPAGESPGKDGSDQMGAVLDTDFHQWTSPFIMAVVNTRVVRRSNALLGFPWGRDFRYDEALLCRSRLSATRNAALSGAGMLAMAVGPIRRLAARFMPSPGEGPDREQREAGYYEIFFHGIHPSDREKDMVVKVTGDMDPGYGSTAKMLGESAVCLALDTLSIGGGFWTPASAMDGKLLQRLSDKAGLTFEIIR
tara:strand:+ start:62042 stop:63265 length:1224 start_codon:yes stop_codon:yes gene_type:complete